MKKLFASMLVLSLFVFGGCNLFPNPTAYHNEIVDVQTAHNLKNTAKNMETIVAAETEKAITTKSFNKEEYNKAIASFVLNIEDTLQKANTITSFEKDDTPKTLYIEALKLQKELIVTMVPDMLEQMSKAGIDEEKITKIIEDFSKKAVSVDAAEQKFLDGLKEFDKKFDVKVEGESK